MYRTKYFLLFTRGINAVSESDEKKNRNKYYKRKGQICSFFSFIYKKPK